MLADHVVRLAGALHREGTRRVFGVCGSGLSYQLAAELKRLGVPYHPVAHEAAAALMAGACSRDGVPGAVALSIKGPGFINMVPGILSNHYEGRPALTVSEAFGPETPSHRKHKRLDHAAVAAPFTRLQASADADAAHVPGLLAAARREPPSPVHLDIFPQPDPRPAPAFASEEIAPVDPARAAEALARLRAAKRPALVLGSAASRLLGPDAFRDCGVPMVTTAAAKGLVDENGPFAAGVITGEVKDLSPESAVLRHADLIVAFGLRNTEMVAAKKFPAALVALDAVDGDLQDGFEADLRLVGRDFAHVARSLLDALKSKGWGADIVRAAREALEAELFQDAWQAPAAFRRLNELLPRATLVLDTGLFCTVGETVWKAPEPARFCGSSCGRFMGTSIPTAIGIACDEPGCEVVCVAGDGGIRPYFPEIKLAVDEKLPILFVLMSDGRYGSIAAPASAYGMDPGPYSIRNPGWWKAAEALGCRGARVQDPAELERALTGWSREDGPLFLEMTFEPGRYAAIASKLR
jgi:acetolactate synthase-1/2/3 large subunit